MRDVNKIKAILQRDVRPEARGRVTDQQLTQMASRIVELDTIDESTIRTLANEIVRDPTAFLCASIDVGDIRNELSKPRK
jgi:hypothetical protein